MSHGHGREGFSFGKNVLITIMHAPTFSQMYKKPFFKYWIYHCVHIDIRFSVSVCITISVSMIVFYAFCQAQGKKLKPLC